MDSLALLILAGFALFPVAMLVDPSGRNDIMSLDLWLGGATALGLLIYLVAVLARAERF